MNQIIDRDSGQLRHFAGCLSQFCTDLGSVADHVSALCGEASGMMRDESGQDALRLLSAIVENLRAETAAAQRLAENLTLSARLMEESETYL